MRRKWSTPLQENFDKPQLLRRHCLLYAAGQLQVDFFAKSEDVIGTTLPKANS